MADDPCKSTKDKGDIEKLSDTPQKAYKPTGDAKQKVEASVARTKAGERETAILHSKQKVLATMIEDLLESDLIDSGIGSETLVEERLEHETDLDEPDERVQEWREEREHEAAEQKAANIAALEDLGRPVPGPADRREPVAGPRGASAGTVFFARTTCRESRCGTGLTRAPRLEALPRAGADVRSVAPRERIKARR